MFRVNKKSIAGLLIVIAMSVAACNNVTGTSPVSSAPSDRTPREPQIYDKVCIDDFRAVEITGPSESRILRMEDFVVITWEAQHVCSTFMADVEISYDGGRNYQLLGSKKNALSMSWTVGGSEGAQVKIRVSVHDIRGTLTGELAVASPVLGRRSQQPDRDPVEHD